VGNRRPVQRAKARERHAAQFSKPWPPNLVEGSNVHMSPPRRTTAIYDTVDGVVHVPDIYHHGSDGLTNTEEFVAWLNSRSKTDPDAPRFAVVTATHLSRTARGGMARHYATYLKGEPAVRVRDAMRQLLGDYTRLGLRGNPVALVQHEGAWEVPQAAQTIAAIAQAANVPFNDARAAFLAYLRAQLGDVMDRAVFPPENAVRPERDTRDEFGDEPWPVQL
jgi:hypothetical protein